MKQLLTFILLGLTVFSYGQKEYLDLKKYEDCRVIIPIKHSYYIQEEDRAVAKQYAGKEIIVIDTKNNLEIKDFYRGFIRIYGQSDAMATYFEPIESVISIDKKYSVYLLYNNRNTYCYDAACWDTKNGKTIDEPKMMCGTNNDTALMYFGNGVLAVNNQKYDLAIKWLSASVKKDSTFCDAWNHLGIAYQLSNDWKGALYSFLEATSLDGTYSKAWINLQGTFWGIGDTTNAITALERFRKNVPDNEYSYQRLNDYYQNIGDTINIKLIREDAIKNNIKIKY